MRWETSVGFMSELHTKEFGEDFLTPCGASGVEHRKRNRKEKK
jgi:hypothetical protein